MATSGTFTFVEALREPTSKHILRWEQSNINPKTFNCEMTINDKGENRNVNVILDKYNTISSGGKEGICLNFAIIENNDEQKILISLVRCNNNEDHFLDEYHLLDELYEQVKKNSSYFNIAIDVSMAF